MVNPVSAVFFGDAFCNVFGQTVVVNCRCELYKAVEGFVVEVRDVVSEVFLDDGNASVMPVAMVAL